MTQRSLAVLIVLNVVLLAAIALTYGPVQEAEAQIGAQGASYMMIAGETAGAQQQVIYVINTQTGDVVAFTYSSANDQLDRIGATNIVEDAEGAGNDR